jgi:hypothetical protein
MGNPWVNQLHNMVASLALGMFGSEKCSTLVWWVVLKTDNAYIDGNGLPGQDDGRKRS